MKSEFTKGMVSVLIPAFNRVDYIAETLESVYNQTYQHIEVIVIDDGSSDGTYEYLLSQRELGKITLLTHENRVNKGQSTSLNKGLNQANGEYIAILDSDDVFELDKLQIQVSFLTNHANCGLVYGNASATDSEGKFLYDIKGKYEVEPNDPNEVLLDCYFSLPSNSLVRRSCYEKAGGFNEAYRAGQDHDMLIRICEVTDIAFIVDKMFRYRKHDDSISQHSLYKRWTLGFKILESAKNRYPYRSTTIRKRRAVLHYRMFEVYLSKNSDRNILKGILHLLFAGTLDPLRALKTIFS